MLEDEIGVWFQWIHKAVKVHCECDCHRDIDQEMYIRYARQHLGAWFCGRMSSFKVIRWRCKRTRCHKQLTDVFSIMARLKRLRSISTCDIERRKYIATWIRTIKEEEGKETTYIWRNVCLFCIMTVYYRFSVLFCHSKLEHVPEKKWCGKPLQSRTKELYVVFQAPSLRNTSRGSEDGGRSAKRRQACTHISFRNRSGEPDWQKWFRLTLGSYRQVRQ